MPSQRSVLRRAEEIAASLSLGEDNARDRVKEMLLDLIDQDCGWAIASMFNGVAAAAQVGEWLRKLEREAIERN